MNHRPNFLLFLVFAFTLAFTISARAEMTVKSSHDQWASFSALKTYAWAASSQPSAKNDAFIKEQVETALLTKGYQKQTAGAPNFYVTYRTLGETKKETVRYNNGRGNIVTQDHQYLKGSLILDVLSQDGSRILWRGWAEAKLDHRENNKKIKGLIEDAVRRILTKFPPK